LNLFVWNLDESKSKGILQYYHGCVLRYAQIIVGDFGEKMEFHCKKEEKGHETGEKTDCFGNKSVE
jgi:hypothetical protein